MEQYFSVSNTVTDFMFKGFNIETTKGLFATIFGLLSLALVYEAMKYFRIYLLLEAAKSPLTYGKTIENIAERSPMVTSLLIPTSLQIVRRRKIMFHFLQTFLHIIQVIFGYSLMLAVMSYNLGLFLAVIFGSTLGYFLFPAHSIFTESSSNTPPVVSTVNTADHSHKTSSEHERSNYASIVPQIVE